MNIQITQKAKLEISYFIKVHFCKILVWSIGPFPQLKIYLLTYGPDLTTEPSLAHYSLSLTHLLANAKLWRWN